METSRETGFMTITQTSIKPFTPIMMSSGMSLNFDVTFVLMFLFRHAQPLSALHSTRNIISITTSVSSSVSSFAVPLLVLLHPLLTEFVTYVFC